MLVLSAKPRISLKNIVVATDFSAASESALDHAVAIARHYNSKILLMHAIGSTPDSQSWDEARIRGADKLLTHAEQKLCAEAEKHPDVECQRFLLTGTALEVVEHILSLDHIDLIVVGTHGTKGVRKLMMGSVAEQIFHHVRCPVLVAGPSSREEKTTWGPKRILLPTDLQSDESQTVEYATALAREHDARLELLHVTIPARAPFLEDSELTIAPYFQSRLRELISNRPALDHPAEVWVEFGDDPVIGILKVAKQRAIDLIVLSVRPREPWTSHFAHNAHRIVAEAPCPVLVVQRRF
jgi:nucleotide-binding universal stress UspA family protein